MFGNKNRKGWVRENRRFKRCHSNQREVTRAMEMDSRTGGT